MAISSGSGSSAGSIRAGRAHVEMSAKDAGLNSALAGIARRMKTVASIAAVMAGAAGIAIGIAAKQIGRMLKELDAVAKAAKRISETTETLSRLGHAAEQSGATLGDVERAAKELQVRIAEAGKGNKAATETFDRLGLSAEKLNRLPLDEKLGLIGDALNSIADPNEKGAIVRRLFGESGANLLPLLREGGQGIRALSLEADMLGETVRGVDASRAERINDAFDEMWKSIRNTLRDMSTLVLGGVDGVEMFTRAIVLGLRDIREFIRAGREMAGGLFPQMAEEFSETWNGMLNAIKGGSLGLALKIARNQFEIEFLELQKIVKIGMTTVGNEVVNMFIRNIKLLFSAIAAGLAAADIAFTEDLRRFFQKAGQGLPQISVTADVGDIQRKIDALKNTRFEDLQRARSLVAENPVFQTALAAAKAAVTGTLIAQRAVKPAGPLSSLGAESRGSFSTFAAQQALGVGTLPDKIEKNTRKAADKLDNIEEKIDGLQLRAL